MPGPEDAIAVDRRQVPVRRAHLQHDDVVWIGGGDGIVDMLGPGIVGGHRRWRRLVEHIPAGDRGLGLVVAGDADPAGDQGWVVGGGGAGTAPAGSGGGASGWG